MTNATSPIQRVILQAMAFAVASSLAVCLPLSLGRLLWPEGLSGGAEFIFWLASGVNVGALLILGWKYWPMILAGVLPAWFIFGQSLEQCLLGAGGNCVEALLAYWILHRLGRFEGRFDRTRPVLSLLFAAGAAPIVASLLVPAYLVLEGRFSRQEFWMAVGNWNLANGSAILVLTPLLVALRNGSWISVRFPREAALWIGAGLLCGAIVFDAVFLERGLNFTFLIFPFIIFAAVRFGPEETSAALLLVMASIYAALMRHASDLNPETASPTLWFIQAFLWVLAATGLVVAALVAERRRAEQLVFAEQSHRLEASLREERARLDALRYQINPHFLFNALNSLRATLPLDAKVPREMVTELAGYLRSTLEHPDEDFASLREEIASIKNYLFIEKKRFGEALQIHIAIAADAETRQVPVFLLQPLVENAIRHGLESSRGPFCLKVEAAIGDGSHLTIEVANTGLWKTAAPGPGKGLGLNNIRRRLQLLYGASATFEQISADGWVRLRIKIPRLI